MIFLHFYFCIEDPIPLKLGVAPDIHDSLTAAFHDCKLAYLARGCHREGRGKLEILEVYKSVDRTTVG